MAAFGPNGFALEELDGNTRSGDVHGLAPHRAQVHFNTAGLVIDLCDVLEMSEVEITVQFAVDAGQQVQVEGSGNS